MAHTNPLAGVRVLDLSRILAGPVCTQLLADLGADVVKVERPGAGDDTRQWGPPFVDDELSAYFIACNRGKRSLALDLQHPAGRSVLDDLLRRADVMIENFLPDSLARLGLTPERLRELNPRLVSVSISAYGRTGAAAALPGYDLIIQARTGLMAITGEPEGRPMKVGVALADVITGLYAATSALAGLVGRSRSNDSAEQGRTFDLALADCTLASLVNIVQSTLVTGRRPQRWGNAHPQIVPYETFATADGHIVLAVGADRQWQRLCAAVEHPEWASDPRFITNPARVEHCAAVVERLRPLLLSRSTSAWQALFEQLDIPHGPVLAVDEALTDPQFAAREMIQPVTDAAGNTYRMLGSAVHWHDEPPRAPLPVPHLGEHSRTVLGEWLEYDAARIDELVGQGVVAESKPSSKTTTS